MTLIKILYQNISRSFLSFPNVYAAPRRATRKDDNVSYVCFKTTTFLAQVRSQRDTSLLNSLPKLDKNVYARTACSC